MAYLATFFTHYGAMRFLKHCRQTGMPAQMLPVPRSLSASCGVCVRFQAASSPNPAEHEDMERCYAALPDGTFLPA